MEIKDIIRDYRNHEEYREEWAFWGDPQRVINLEIAIELAGLAMCDGRKMSHQKLIPKPTLAGYAKELLKRKHEIGEVQSFPELLKITASCRIYGIGELAVYDAAFRIGIFLRIEPDAVYLHAGPRIGAENLLKRRLFPSKVKTITKEDLPEAFRDCSYAEIEAILCIYKDCFATLRCNS